MIESIYTNARVVTATSEFDGSVVVHKGRIVEVDDAPCRAPGVVDLDGDFLVPGLIASWIDRQGVAVTLGSMMTVVIIARLALLLIAGF